ncbi:MAG: hypothetical protein IJB57_01865 [Clostridia bacterium]|nr:hypothetical protein [Clostridia bacterium]
MKVIDLIKVCRGNAKFRFDTEETLIDRQNALKVCWEKGILDREVAAVTFDACTEDSSQYPSTQKNVPGAAVICEISTIYEDIVQA